MRIMDIIRKLRADRAAGRQDGLQPMHPRDHAARCRVRQIRASRRGVRILADGSIVIRRRPRHSGLPICIPRDVRAISGKAVPACR